METNSKVKRLEFIKLEDSYFLIYNILLILYNLKAIKFSSKVKDFRKISHLIQLVSSDEFFQLFKDSYGIDGNLNRELKKFLKNTYIKNIEANEKIKLILLMLENNNYISLENEKNEISVVLKKEKLKLISNFLNDDIFKCEKEKIEEILKIEPRIRSLKYSTFLERFYKINGVELWDV